MSRAQLTSTVEQNSAGAAAPVVGYKNFVANGSFDIWQRGTSISPLTSSGTYTADRWQGYRGSSSGSTVSRQATSDTTNLPNIQYCVRVQRNSGDTSTSDIQYGQSLESVNSIPLAGKTITFSYYARAGANYSATSSLLKVYVQSGTGTDQNVITTGYTGNTNVVNGVNVTLTTTWQRFTHTGTVPTSATELGFLFDFFPIGTAGTNDYFEVTGVQLEVGSVATPFSRAAGTLQGELALAQRYYCRWTDVGGYMGIAGMANNNGTIGVLTVPFPVSMRVQPTSIDYAQLSLYDLTTVYSFTSLTIQNATTNSGVLFAVGASGMTTYRPIVLISTSGTAYFGLSAEL
jgi:hypothetical protein